jgi:hypothetical protein
MPDDPAGTSESEDTAPADALPAPAPFWLDLLCDLSVLSDQLGRLQKTVAARHELEKTSPATPKDQRSDGLERALARLEHKIDGLTGLLSPADSRPAAVAHDLRPARPPEPEREGEDSQTAIYSLLTAIVAKLSASQTGTPQSCAGSASPGPGAECSDHPDRWGRVILGDDLWLNPAVEADRHQLIDGFLNRDPAVCGLAALLLLFQSSPPERLPLLIKDLGEAYYRWQPRVSDPVMPFEAALSAWVIKVSEAAGVRNRIELVRPGARFNPQLHKAHERGIEVTQVLGWVVLREDGGVFQKASVAVK